MGAKLNYFLASLFLCSTVFVWWIDGFDWFLETGWLNIAFCLVIFIVGLGHYIAAFYHPPLAWVGSDNSISLGLLGTVVGLVLALPQVQGNIEAAMQGIAMALLTTAVGLMWSVVLYNQGVYLGLGEEENLQ